MIRNILLVVIAVLLAMTCYFTYCSALVYGTVPINQMTDEQNIKCLNGQANGLGDYYCPKNWHLKGGE